MIRNTTAFPPRFVFHGNAVAADVFLTKVGGVEQPIYHPIDGQSSLPVIGGVSESEVLEPKFDKPLSDVFFYRACRTRAEGIFQGSDAVTTVQASVEDVRVTNREKPGAPENLFRAGELSLTIRSIHDLKGQPRFDFTGRPVFKGLSLNGLPIELQLNDELMGCATWGDLEKRYRTDKPFYDSCPFASYGDRQPAFPHEIPHSPGSYALTSFVQSILWGDRLIPGHVLIQPGFGAIYFGEILLNDSERRVTMVRMLLGCDNVGQSALVETDPNGSQVPPKP